MSSLNLIARPFNLKLKHPFGISRGTSTLANNVLITVFFDDYVGYGEAAPSSFYGETQESVIEFIQAFSKNRALDKYLTNLNTLKEDLESFNLHVGHNIKSNLFSYSARLGIEMAFWDLVGKINQKPLYECLFKENPFLSKKNNGGMPPTSFTIGLDSPETVSHKTKEALSSGFNLLKIKLGQSYDDDLKLLNTIKEAANGHEYTIRVDANCGWNLETTKKMLDVFPEYNVELLEQPLPRGQSSKLAPILDESPVPIIADEDCVTVTDIESLAGNVHGVNVKLMKSGGILEALNMINLAKSYNLKVMIGCMIESSCSISAAVHLSPLADYIDLDGHLLLDPDPFTGLLLEGNKVLPSFSDGLGVEPKEMSNV